MPPERALGVNALFCEVAAPRAYTDEMMGPRPYSDEMVGPRPYFDEMVGPRPYFDDVLALGPCRHHGGQVPP